MSILFSKIKHYIPLIFLVILSAVPRFTGLGYSHFYGDETKVLYLDKTVPASTFFLDQRKGPIQFFIAWIMEKLTGGYNEFWIRLPFASAGLAAVVVFYFLVKKMFGDKVAFLASLLYSFSGFSIAFSRTAQYQSFLHLFGFLGILFFLCYYFGTVDTLPTKNILLQQSTSPAPERGNLLASNISFIAGKYHYLLLSSLAYALAFYCHYDAIWFLIPTLLFIRKGTVKNVFLYFLLPMLSVVILFYVPYVVSGYFETNTVGYLSRRLAGVDQSLPNSSWITYLTYNPFIPYFGLLVVGLLLVAQKKFAKDVKLKILLIWFILPFVTFELVFKNPGTHIQNYLIPLYIISPLGIVDLITNLPQKFKVFSHELFIKPSEFYSGRLYYFLLLSITFILLVQVVSSFYIFVPMFKADYPWKDSKLGLLRFSRLNKMYQLFTYGFPYNRDWPQIADKLYAAGARGFYTNDNAVMAKYYVNKLNFTEPGTNFYPVYFVYVFDSQEQKYPTDEFLSRYVQTDYVGDRNSPNAIIYRLKAQ